MFNLLLVEDDDADAELIQAELASAGLLRNMVRATSAQEVRAALSDLHDIDAVLCDYNLPDLDVLGALEMMEGAGLTAPLIVVSGGLSDEQAAECMRGGAADYVHKDRLHRLPHALRQAIRQARAEEAAREVERIYLRLFENVPMTVMLASAEGQIVHANPAAVAMFGFADLDSLLAAPLASMYVDPNDRTVLLKRLQAEGSVLDFESLMRRADGSEFWFNRAAHAVRQKDGGIVEIEVIGRDATERREVLRRLRESDAYLTQVVETAPDAMVGMDESGVITDWNSAAQKTFGWQRADVIGRRVSETIIPPQYRGRHEEGLKRFLRDGPRRLIGHGWAAFEGLRRDGEIFPIELAISPPVAVGETRQFVAFVRDVSERKRAEQALAESEEVFRALFEQSSVGISLRDVPRNGLAGRTRWNSRMRELYGADADLDDDPSGQSGFGEAERMVVQDRHRRLLAGEDTLVRERRMLTRPDGTTVWIDGSTILVRDRDTQPLRFQTMALDITEQVEAEQSISRRIIRQTAIAELARAGLEGGAMAEFLSVAVELVARATGSPFATILELRPSDNSFIPIAAHGHSEGIPPEPIPLDQAAALLDLLKGDMRLVAFDFQNQPEIRRGPWMIEHGVVASMTVGIRGPVQPLGVLSVHSNVARQFSADEIEFMQLAATIIAVAVERKRGEIERRLLLSRLVSAQEAERKTIAEDIHDDAVQVMTAANMRLELFRMVLTDPVQVDAAEKLQETISLATGRLRNLLFELSPPNLASHGLAAACRTRLVQFESDTRLSWQLNSALDREPPPDHGILLFRIFQEALVNVGKHARAKTVSVSLKIVDGGVMLRVSDDGAGFHRSAADPVAGHLGLASMRERAEIAGGWWRMTSEPGQGTEVTAWVPLSGEEDRVAARASGTMEID